MPSKPPLVTVSWPEWPVKISGAAFLSPQILEVALACEPFHLLNKHFGSGHLIRSFARLTMIEWIASVIGRGGLWGLAFLAFLENIFPPIPSELIMPCAGYLVKQGKLSFIGATAFGALGSALGSLPLYYASRILGEKRVRQLLERYGKWIGLGNDEYDKTRDWFARYGNRAVLWCRMIPGLRGIISIPAGTTGMPITKFVMFTYLGCFFWTFFLVVAGYWLGESFIKVEHFLGPASKFIVVGAVAFLLWRAYKKNSKSNGDAQQPHAA